MVLVLVVSGMNYGTMIPGKEQIVFLGCWGRLSGAPRLVRSPRHQRPQKHEDPTFWSWGPRQVGFQKPWFVGSSSVTVVGFLRWILLSLLAPSLGQMAQPATGETCVAGVVHAWRSVDSCECLHSRGPLI